MSLNIHKVNEIMENATKQNISPTPPSGLTKKQLFFWKLQNDFPWYAENFLKIRNKDNKLVSFKLNDAQIKIEALDRYCIDNKVMRRYIVLKARQMGISTYTEGKIFHNTSNSTLVRSMIVAHEEKASSNLFNMSKLFYEELPETIRPMKRFNNGKILSFENPVNDENEKQKNPGLRSNITIATAGTGEVGRSATPSNLHISELAFFPDASTTMIGLMQGVPDSLDTLVILESTANGVGDYFYTQWKLAMNGESDFIPIFLAWFTDSTYIKEFYTENQREDFINRVNQIHYDSNGKELHTFEFELMKKHSLTYEQLHWRDWAIKNKCGGDEVLFNQEYPSTAEEAFIASGRPKFAIQTLKKYLTLARKPLKRGYLQENEHGKINFLEDEHGYISIWKMPDANIETAYAIGADVAEGLERGDYSCGIVGDQDFNIAAMWHGHIDPDLFGDELYKLGKFYNQAYIGVESNNHGLTTLKRLQQREYWDLYYQKTYDRMIDQITTKLGWGTNLRTKPLMIDKLSEFVREMYIDIPSELIIHELFTYIIEDNGSTNAQSGCNDDTVMALAILLQVLLEGRGENYTPESSDEKVSRRIRDKEVVDKLFESDAEQLELSL